MLSLGCEYTAEITDCTVLGAGVTRIDGCAVFVKGAVTGDICRFEVTEVKKNFALAKLVEITRPSQKRIVSDCAVSDRCGGCTLRHVSAEYEAQIKESTVKSAFRKAGLSDVNVRHTIVPSQSHYRNNVQLHFDISGAFGFYEEETNTVCPLSETGCAVIPSIFYEIGKASSEIFKESSLPYPARLSLRQALNGDICVSLTHKTNNDRDAAFAEKLMERFPCIKGVVARCEGDSHYSVVRGDRYIETNLCGLRLRVSPEVFFQVNYEGAELLFSKVIEYAERCSFNYCADLYCGTGVIGMILASQYPKARFTGVEINAEAVEDAKRNAELNNIENIDFYCGDAGRFAAKESPELVVVDPPRKGLSDRMINVIKDISPENVIYVSCNPFTLARDVKKLTDFGYKIYEATPVNMFPRSGHVESVVRLERRLDN